MRHGNRHGYAWYRKTFSVKPQPEGKRYFLFFEGVGSSGNRIELNRKGGTLAGGGIDSQRTARILRVSSSGELLLVRHAVSVPITDIIPGSVGIEPEKLFEIIRQPVTIRVLREAESDVESVDIANVDSPVSGAAVILELNGDDRIPALGRDRGKGQFTSGADGRLDLKKLGEIVCHQKGQLLR